MSDTDFNRRQRNHQLSILYLCTSGPRYQLGIAGAFAGQTHCECGALPVKFDSDARVTQGYSCKLGFIPLGGQLWSDAELVLGGVPFQSEHSPQRWGDHHCRRPYLMRCAAAEPAEEFAREQLRDSAQILFPGEVRVLHKVGISRERTMISIFRKRDPSREQRPHAALVITDQIVKAHS